MNIELVTLTRHGVEMLEVLCEIVSGSTSEYDQAASMQQEATRRRYLRRGVSDNGTMRMMLLV